MKSIIVIGISLVFGMVVAIRRANISHQGVDFRLQRASFVLYYGPTMKDFSVFSVKTPLGLLKDKRFDASKPSTCYIHGFLETQNVESIATVVKAYYKRNDQNIITLDWSLLANDSYIKAAYYNVQIIGTALAMSLESLFQNGLDIQKFHLVGHSLGGQVAGVAGRKLLERSNGKFKLKRITGLDPAFPGFFNTFVSPSISPKDAEFVDIIHTDSGFYGIPFRAGHADFFPNGGFRVQPGCPIRVIVPLSDTDLCSHRRSWRFWAESVSGGDQFFAIPAKTYGDFLTRKNLVYTKKTDIIPMGLDCPVTASGTYFLRTNAKSPFAKGNRGLN